MDSLIQQGLDDSTSLGKQPRDEMVEGKDQSIHLTCTDVNDSISYGLGVVGP